MSSYTIVDLPLVQPHAYNLAAALIVELAAAAVRAPTALVPMSTMVCSTAR